MNIKDTHSRSLLAPSRCWHQHYWSDTDRAPNLIFKRESTEILDIFYIREYILCYNLITLIDIINIRQWFTHFLIFIQKLFYLCGGQIFFHIQKFRQKPKVVVNPRQGRS